jgi:hypothetical protein
MPSEFPLNGLLGSESVSFGVMPAKLLLAEAGSGHPLLDHNQMTDFSASNGKLTHYAC